MKIRLKNKWRRISQELTPNEQLSFLLDSMILYRESPERFLLMYLSVAIIFVIMIGYGLSIMPKIILGLALVHLVYNTYNYNKLLKDFYVKWYTEK
jgi:hypothetical protein